jgi:hypothetical protein
LASLLRALSTAPGPASTPADAPAGGTPDYPAPPSGRPSPDDEVWRGATRTGHDSWPAPERDVWAAATRAPTETRSDRAAPPADPGDGA